jgi:TonB family protein
MKLRMLLLTGLLIANASIAQEKSATVAAAAEQKSPATAPTSEGRNLEVLSDTQGVDFGPYLSIVVKKVRGNWYKLIPEVARPPLLKQGEVSVQFAIMPDGKVSGMMLSHPSGDIALDRAAWGAITASAPFELLPREFHGPYLALRMHFLYNPPKQAKAPDSK